MARNVHEESPQPAFHSKESRRDATASNPEPRNHDEEWYPLQCFINQYFLVSNDGAIGVFANCAIVRSCSEMQVLGFRKNRSTRKRKSTTWRTFRVFSPQQVLWQPKTKITAHINYLYCPLCKGLILRGPPQINSSTNTVFYFMIASIVVAPSVDSYSGPNKCLGRVTCAPVLDWEHASNIEVAIGGRHLKLHCACLQIPCKSPRLYCFHFQKIFQKKPTFWAPIIPLWADLQWINDRSIQELSDYIL